MVRPSGKPEEDPDCCLKIIALKDIGVADFAALSYAFGVCLWRPF